MAKKSFFARMLAATFRMLDKELAGRDISDVDEAELRTALRKQLRRHIRSKDLIQRLIDTAIKGRQNAAKKQPRSRKSKKKRSSSATQVVKEAQTPAIGEPPMPYGDATDKVFAPWHAVPILEHLLQLYGGGKSRETQTLQARLEEAHTSEEKLPSTLEDKLQRNVPVVSSRRARLLRLEPPLAKDSTLEQRMDDANPERYRREPPKKNLPIFVPPIVTV